MLDNSIGAYTGCQTIGDNVIVDLGFFALLAIIVNRKMR